MQTSFTIIQFFHWYFKTEDNLWNHCSNESDRLAAQGFSHIWLPPANKSAKGDTEPGYAVYDLYDLGEFRQKGSVRTKHGTRDEFLACVESLHRNGIKVLADIVLNHRFDGDVKELVKVVNVSEENRNKNISEEYNITAPTVFTFPERKGKYSNFKWDYSCFSGLRHEGKIKRIINQYSKNSWETLPDKQHGNFDYLMANDIEFRNPQVRVELMRWGKWFVDTTGIDGFRLDGLKHIAPDFPPAWLDHLNSLRNEPLFSIGEYWKKDVASLMHYLDLTGRRIRLFDVLLHAKFHRAGIEKNFDLRTIFQHTLTEAEPDSAITFVDNHDTQALQTLQSPVSEWFRPHAYAFILLRRQGTPCVFYPDLYGANYSAEDDDGKTRNIAITPLTCLPKLLRIRRQFALGKQLDYFTHRHLVGWTRQGEADCPHSGCAVVLSNGKAGELKMFVGKHFAGKMFTDATGGISGPVIIDQQGSGIFPVKDKNVSVYIPDKDG